MKAKVRELDPADYLDKPREAVGYLNVVLACEGPDALPAALRNVARSKALKKLARRKGEAPWALREALDLGDEPSFAEVSEALAACGLKLEIVRDKG